MNKSFNKILLLSILSLSCLNADYINIPAGYYQSCNIPSGDDSQYCTSFYVPELNVESYGNYKAELNGVFRIGGLPHVPMSTDTTNINPYANAVKIAPGTALTPTGFGCSINAYTGMNNGEFRSTECTYKGGALIYVTVKAGTYSSTPTPTYDDTALKSENAILKAKVQALESKVYSCVQ